jgi:putative ABC transport system permease protein
VKFLENLIDDVKHAGRVMWRSPGFSATAIAALALGIGANTAIFSVVNAVLLAPLAYPHADRLVELELSSPQGNADITSVPKFNVWRGQKQVFEAVAAYDFSGPGINLTGNGLPEQLKGIHASAEYFDVFGVSMARGRAYTEQEDVPNGPNVVVISNVLWRGRFGSDPGIIGRTIELGGDAYTVVGVTGPTFRSDPQANIWLPLRADPNSTDQGHYLKSTALLKPGVTVGQAQAAMKVAAEQFRRKFSSLPIGPTDSFTAVPLKDSVIGDFRKGLLLLLGAVGFVLLIACANVANLLLARATLRKREIALRAALGAGRRRIIEQLLTESILLSLVGGVLGLAIGYVGVKALLAASPVRIPRIGEHGASVALDWRVLGFTLLVAVVTGILFGLIPALNASRTDLSSTLKESGMRSGGSVKQNKARSILVVSEMALALILLVGAALLIRTFAVLRGVKPGFDAHNILTMDMSLAGGRYTTAAAIEQLERDGRQRVETVPGVEAAAMTCCLPYEGGYGLPFNIVGQPPKNGDPYTGGANYMLITPEYFKVFRIPLVTGRAFNDLDGGGGGRVAIINEAMSKQYWPKGGAVGSQIVIGKGVGPEFEEGPRQIVGVVGDIHAGGLDQPAFATMYIPLAQTKDGIIALNNRIAPQIWVVRTRVQPFSLSNEIQRELRDASSGLPVGNVRSMEQVTGESLGRNDFNMTLLTIFAGVALLLAAIGIYGLMAYSVQQRTQEIGIRMALGASPEKVRAMVVRQGMLLAGIGVAIGVGAALGLTRLMAGMIYGVKTWDPAAFVTVVVVLSGVSLLATYVPARRASRVDPMVSLRYE